MNNPFGSIGILLSLCVLVGCQENGKQIPQKNPRPVETATLGLSSPPKSALVSASVASWKTEQIGFEVSGRIKSVKEPNTAIEPRVVEVVEGERKVALEGTPIAEIEDQRYQLKYEIAVADVDRAEQALAAANIELDKSLASQMLAAEADNAFAIAEFERAARLRNQNAVPQADFDRAKANRDREAAKIEQLKASILAKGSEIVSKQLEIKQAQQALRDAKRELDDCTLYSSFPGQIAEIAVVPGSVVSAGQPVATIQMINPIKIELEVSAEKSRELRSRQLIPIWLAQPNGADPVQEDGFLYLIDPVADPQTRTFTVTLLVLNKILTIETPGGDDIPVTNQAWRLNLSFLPGVEQGATYVAEQAIHRDAEGYFLWRIENLKQRELMPANSLLKVKKMRIELGEARLPFLGNWFFQQVVVLEPTATFDPQVNLVAGKLEVTSGDPDDWNGQWILVDRSSQWMLRPGDVVQVDLGTNERLAEKGFYVPMDALARESGKTFLFVVEESGPPGKTEDGSTGYIVKRIEVKVADENKKSTSSLRRISHADGDPLLTEGLRYVTRGVHYLRDGEPVRIAATAGAAE